MTPIVRKTESDRRTHRCQDPAIQIALFITCLATRCSREAGSATVRAARAPRRRVDFPLEQTCCGQMHFNTGYARRGDPARAAASSRTFAASEFVRSSPVGLVRGDGARPLPRALAERVRRRRAGRRASTRSTPRVLELSRVARRPARASRTSARYFPHRVTYHPTCHGLRMLALGETPLRLLRAVRGIDLVELPEAHAVLRLRRHVRDQERRHLDRDADRQGPRDPRHRRRGLHRAPTARA